MADVIYIIALSLLAVLLVFVWIERPRSSKQPTPPNELSIGYTALMLPTVDGEAEFEQYPDRYNLQVVAWSDPPVVRVEHHVQAGQRAYCRIRPSARGIGVGMFRGDDDDGCAVLCGRFVDLTPLQRALVNPLNGPVSALVFEPQHADDLVLDSQEETP
jgi:hypothetical protein